MDGATPGVLALMMFGPSMLADEPSAFALKTAQGEASHDPTSFVAAWPGFINTLIGNLTDPVAIGTLTLTATINGAPVAATVLEIGAGVADRAKVLGCAVARFQAGDRIGCVAENAAAWDDTDTELLAGIGVRYETEPR